VPEALKVFRELRATKEREERQVLLGPKEIREMSDRRGLKEIREISDRGGLPELVARKG
jgi:hypothetical protein